MSIGVLRGIEESRLRALVEGDADAAREFHADDFQLITPFGMAIGKDAYLNGIATGEVDCRGRAVERAAR